MFNNIFGKITRSRNIVFRTILFVFLLPFAMMSCKKSLEQKVVADEILKISASTTNVVLLQRNQNNTAIELTWTKGTNGGTNAALSYTFEMDKKGNNFASPLTVFLGKFNYSQKYTVKELNEIALVKFGLLANVAGELEVRVKASVASDLAPAQVSNVVIIKITPYTAVSSTLYIIGNATSTGWDANTAAPLTAGLDPTIFTWQGSLVPGEFKFITNRGQFLPSYNKGASATSLFYRTDNAQPDDKFVITQAGLYLITVNLVDLTITIQAQAGPPYARLWIVGDATPNGWDINNPNEMRVDTTDPFIFTYNEVLKAGEFKIPTSTGNWGTDFYMPLTNNPAITNMGVRLVPGGSPDYKWKITTPGPYKITLNLRDMTISIKPFTPYSQLWIVGDATPNGWNINAPNQMVKNATNPYVFTYTGPLNAGEFKIPVATGNWGTDYFMPAVANQAIGSQLAKFVPGGNPDYKWKLTQAGNYIITLNQLYERITIVKQ